MEHVESFLERVEPLWEPLKHCVRGEWSTSAFEKYGISDAPFPLTDEMLPVLASCIYLLITLALNPKDNTKKRSVPLVWKGLVIFYNISMTWFSYRVFMAIFPLLREQWDQGKSPAECICSASALNWDVIGFNGWLFYLSKFYEFFDTLQILAKRRNVIFLHYYHHAGAALMMWALLLTKSPAILIFLVLNSFIHTGMYFYYLITSFGIRVPNALKSLVTTSQIVQFLIGTYLVLALFREPGCINPGQRVATAFTVMYVMVLLGLFVKFFFGAFLAPRKTSSKKAKTA